MSRVVTSTYRLQLTRDFPFAAARRYTRYFHELGISHLYLSPVLAARPGSAHGYDVIDHTRVNPELGTEEELRAFANELHTLGMGIILDIVPNHMSASSDNRYWDDVLERGRASRFAGWFDIDWDAPAGRGKVVLPVLGDDLDRVLERHELKLQIRDSGSRIAYFDKTFPLDPSTLPREIQLAQFDPAGRPAVDDWARGDEGRKRLRRLLDAQNYRLRFWRKGATEINYRRFFDVNDLVALRMENDAVFDATHALVLQWVRDGVLDGLRVDHVDGLRDPASYLTRLRNAVATVRHPDGPNPVPIFVEKILSGDEELPAEWPVQGTTGYEFMNEAEEVFLEPDGFRAIERTYRALRHRPTLTFRQVARDSKRRVVLSALRPDVMRLARLAHQWNAEVSVDDFAAAIVEVIVHLGVYRTYIAQPGAVSDVDRRQLQAAFRAARTGKAADDAALRALERAFFDEASPEDTLRLELVSRFQQTSGPATAKGVEDTALYAYMPLASRNEVGGHPDHELSAAASRLHTRNAQRQRAWPHTLLATNTHDTKRSADLRARIDALTALPDVWSRHVARWRRLNRPHKKVAHGRPAPDPNSEYLYYQTLLGLWPAPRPQRRVDDLPSQEWLERVRGRLVAYMLKAAREAKTRTSWTEADPDFEKALDGFVKASLDARDDAPFLGDVARLTAQTADAGFRFALARILLHHMSPGTPDTYQGDELWNFTLVDPDNRRPVDFDLRAKLLAEKDPCDTLRRAFAGEIPLANDAVKLALTTLLLRFRRDHGDLARAGEYVPLQPREVDAGSAVFAFARRSQREACIVVARTSAESRGTEEMRVEAPSFELAGSWTSVLTGRAIELVHVDAQPHARVDDLVPKGQPCELLFRPNP